MIRVGVLGKNNIAIEATKVLLTKKCEIVFVSPNNNDIGEDKWQLSYKKFCLEKGLFIKQFDKIKSSESIDYLTRAKLDFLFSFQYDQIINQAVINTAKYGAINLHFAPLPLYRGVSPIGFAMLNGEKEFGLTIHYMDPGVDTGDIIAQNKFEITHLNNARELYDLCNLKGKELFNENITDILEFKNSRKPQDNSRALYYPLGSINFKNNIVKWNKDTNSLYNWIKAFIFPPFQYPRFIFNGIELEIVYASPDFRKNNFEKPGTIIFNDKNYFKIATHDSYINIITKKT